jgi:SAM-dependent methyltransferase
MDFLQTISDDAVVFDVGCGTGYWMEAAIRCGVRPDRIFGIDLAANSLVAMRQKGLKGFVGGAGALALPYNASHVTICNGVIHHTRDPFQAFQELVRITRPGGQLFLGVYCQWNPYFYLIHKATWPLRFIYWNWTERVLDLFWPGARRLIMAAARLLTGVRLSEETAKTLFMDQLITPYARLFSKRTLKRYAARCRCDMIDCRLTKGGLMWAAVFKVSVHTQAADPSPSGALRMPEEGTDTS